MTTTQNRSSILLVVLGVVAVAAIALIAALVISSGGDDEPSTLVNAGPVIVSGDPLPRFELPDPATGLSAPSFSGLSSDGSQVEVTAEGPVLIGFFAHWCPHCQAELPDVVEWLDGNPGIDVVAVSTGASSDADNWPPAEWLDREGFDSTLVMDSPDGEIAAAYGLSAFPYWVAVDASGRIAQRVTGQLGTAGLDALADAARG